MMTEQEQLRELADRLGNIWQGVTLGDVGKADAIKQTKDALEQAGYVQLDEEQGLPEIKETKAMLGTVAETLYLKQEIKLKQEAQQDMFNSGFRRIRREHESRTE